MAERPARLFIEVFCGLNDVFPGDPYPVTEDTQPRVVDFDDGEISVRLDGKDLRVWEYRDEAERRVKMLCAREYVEGWCDGRKI